MTCDKHDRPTFGCAECIAQRDFGPPPGSFPDWYKPAQNRKQQNRNVGRGLHPMGLALVDGDQTCGECVHFIGRIGKGEWGRTAKYKKCALVANTHGAATDIRVGWRACEKWAPLELDDKTNKPKDTTP